MTFNPYPDHSFADRRLSTDFTVAFYDENNILIYQMTITPIIARNTVQTVWLYKKSVVFYDENYSYFNKVDKSMIPMSSKYPTTEELKINGMDDLQSITTPAVSELKPMSMEYTIQDRIFSKSLNLKKYSNIKKVATKS